MDSKMEVLPSCNSSSVKVDLIENNDEKGDLTNQNIVFNFEIHHLLVFPIVGSLSSVVMFHLSHLRLCALLIHGCILVVGKAREEIENPRGEMYLFKLLGGEMLVF